LFGNVWETRKDRQLFGEMYIRTFENLSQGKSVVLDATNISSRKRTDALQNLKPYYKECYYIKIPLSKALYWNKKRDRNVPENAIRHFHRTLEPPQLVEGWDKINIISESED
jgi:predicted kinase